MFALVCFYLLLFAFICFYLLLFALVCFGLLWFNQLAQPFSLAPFLLLGPAGYSLGYGADFAAIFLALRDSCGTLAHDISRRGHLIFVFDLARAAHLAH